MFSRLIKMKDLTHYFNTERNSCANGSCDSDIPQANQKVVQQEFIDLCGDDDEDSDHDPLCISCDHHTVVDENSSSRLLNGSVLSIKKNCIKESIHKKSKRLKLNRSKERIFTKKKCSQSEENKTHANIKKVGGESCDKWFKLKPGDGSKAEESSKRKLNFNEEDISKPLKKAKPKENQVNFKNIEFKEYITQSNNDVLKNVSSSKKCLISEHKLESEKGENSSVLENKCKVLIKHKPKKQLSLTQNKIILRSESDENIEKCDNRNKTDILIDISNEESNSTNCEIQPKYPEQIKIDLCVSTPGVLRNENSCDSGSATLDSFSEKSAESPETTEKSKVCNGLFKYFNKVDKDEYIAQTENQKITVEVVVHSPPGDVNTALKTSAKKVIHRRNRSKITEQLNSSDRIDVISSEPLVTTDKNNDESVRRSLPNSHLKTSCTNCTEKINMLNNKRTLTNGSCTDLEKCVHNVNLSDSKKDMKCDVDTSICKNNSSNLPDNKKGSTVPTGPQRGSWVMRVRLSSSTVKENQSVELSEEEDSQDSNDSLECVKLEPSDTESSVIEVENNNTGDIVLNTSPLSDAESERTSEELQKSTPAVKENQSVELSEEEDSQDSNDSLECVKLEPSDTESSVIEVENNNTGDIVLNTGPLSDAESERTSEELQKSTPVQLCAIFLKNRKSKKCVPDPLKVEAKARFLESGTPDIIKRIVDSQRSEPQGGIPAQFPTVNHVQQHDMTRVVWNNKTASDLKLAPTLPPLQHPSPIPWSSLSQHLPLPSNPGSKLMPVVNRKESLKELIDQEPEMDVKSWYKSFTERRRKNSVTGEPVADTFTDVYKPACAADIVGNTESVGKLKAWLESQKKCLKKEDSDSSGDEFVSYDSEDEIENKRVNSMVILCGPYGCGKTSTVYALANELGYKVLEINASCNRNGKRILSELLESTQSHHVEHSQSQMLSYCMAGKKRKKEKDSKLETNESVSRKTALILVEDADLLFYDHDDGFLNAISSLAATSKRPIILVSNDPNCPHLMKFSDCLALKLQFTKPRASRLGVWLRTLALVEGVSLSKELAIELVQMNNRDVRRCLLQLQIYILSGVSEVCNEVTGDGLWWQWPSEYNLQFYLPTVSGPKSESKQELTDKKQVRQVMDSIVKMADRLSTFDGLTSKYSKAWYDTPCPLSWKVTPKDGTSLQVPVGGETDGTASELYSWISARVKGEIQQTVPHEKRTNSNAEKRWRSLLWQAQEFFLQGISPTMHCSRQAIASDYLPMFRTVGRSERIRLEMYSRRGNRYFNYLQNLGIKANKSFKDFMCDMFA